MKSMKYKQLNQDEFDKIKMLAEVGVTNRQIKDITGRGHATVSRIIAADSMESYRAALTALRKKYAKPTPPFDSVIPKTETGGLSPEVVRVLENINESLLAIRSSLE